jgi:hypothetical protein
MMKKQLLIVAFAAICAGIHNAHAAAEGIVVDVALPAAYGQSTLTRTLEKFATMTPHMQTLHDKYSFRFLQEGFLQATIGFEQRKSSSALNLKLCGQPGTLFTMGNLWMQHEPNRTTVIPALLQLQHPATRKQMLTRIHEYVEQGGDAQEMALQAHYSGTPGSVAGQSSRYTTMAAELTDEIYDFLNQTSYAPITQSDRIDAPIRSIAQLYAEADKRDQYVVVGKLDKLRPIRSLSDIAAL